VRVHEHERQSRPHVCGNHLGGVDPGVGEGGGERVPVGVVAHPGDQGGARTEKARRDRLVAALAAGAH
jgi:hypothetical protein